MITDEGVDPQLLGGVLTDDMERLHHMRRMAQKAFAEARRAVKGRSRMHQECQSGDYVFVYRILRARKKRGGGVEQLEASNEATWVGPGTVVLAGGTNVWVIMVAELWKVAREQCRLATTDEKTGIGAINQECRELIEEYKRNARYRDAPTLAPAEENLWPVAPAGAPAGGYSPSFAVPPQ